MPLGQCVIIVEFTIRWQVRVEWQIRESGAFQLALAALKSAAPGLRFTTVPRKGWVGTLDALVGVLLWSGQWFPDANFYCSNFDILPPEARKLISADDLQAAIDNTPKEFVERAEAATVAVVRAKLGVDDNG